MKGILTLYIKMLRELGYDSVRQFKLRVTKEDMKAYGIRPDQHKLQHVRKALQYLKNEGNKIPLRTKSSMTRASLDIYRRNQMRKVDEILARCAEGSKDQRYYQAMRDRIEKSLTMP